MTEKIAYFTGTYPNLTETFVQREIDFHRNHGTQVFVFAIRRPDDLGNASRRSLLSKSVIYARPDHLLQGIGLLFFTVFRHPLAVIKCTLLILRQIIKHPLPIVISLFSHFLSAVVFCHFLRKLNISHIHAHFSSASTIALFCHYLEGYSFSFPAHASGDIYVNPILLNEKIESASFVIADAFYNLAYLNLVTDYRYEKKIFVVHNGVEVPDEPIDRNVPRQPIEIVSVGSFTYFKGYPTLIKALALLINRKYDFHCIIIGDGPQRKIIEKLIARENLIDKISVLGSVEHAEMTQMIAQADIFVLASEIYLSGIRDGLPTVCTEAMALGLPVVSTYISCIPDLIQDGFNGLLVPEKNPLQLATAIERLINDKDLRISLGLNAHDSVKKDFNIEMTMVEFNEIMTQTLNNKVSN